MDRYETLPHTADIGVMARGDSLADVIANTAYGMFDITYDLAAIEPQTTVVVGIEADSPTELLVDVLSDLLARSEIDDLVLVEFVVETDGLRATVTATGGPTAEADLTGPPIKAVTYHDLRCERMGDHWESRIIFDV